MYELLDKCFTSAGHEDCWLDNSTFQGKHVYILLDIVCVKQINACHLRDPTNFTGRKRLKLLQAPSKFMWHEAENEMHQFKC